jgi:hypothetical protein
MRSTFFEAIVSVLILAFTLVCNPQAEAQGVTQAVNGKCPTGWYQRNGYCEASGFISDPRAVPASGKKCPTGWRKQQKHCIPNSNSSANTIEMNSKGGCPTGYRRAPNSNFCIENG